MFGLYIVTFRKTSWQEPETMQTCWACEAQRFGRDPFGIMFLKHWIPLKHLAATHKAFLPLSPFNMKLSVKQSSFKTCVRHCETVVFEQLFFCEMVVVFGNLVTKKNICFGLGRDHWLQPSLRWKFCIQHPSALTQPLLGLINWSHCCKGQILQWIGLHWSHFKACVSLTDAKGVPLSLSGLKWTWF